MLARAARTSSSWSAAGLAAGDRFGPGDAGDLRGFGVDLEVAVRRAACGRAAGGVPLAHTARRLAARRGRLRGHPGRGRARPTSARWSGDLPGPLGVLAMGDGSARRTVKAPGYLDDAAAPVRRRGRRGAGRRGRRRAGRARPGRGGAPARRRGADLAGRRRRAGRPRRHRAGCTSTPRRSGSATSSPTGPPRDRSARPSSPSSARPPPARPRWRSSSPGASAARWSTPTRCSSTAAWTSGRRSPTPPSAAACRTTCSTSGTSGRPASVAEYRDLRAGRDRPAARGRGGARCWSAGRGCTSAPSSTSWSSPAPTPTVRARLEAELADVGAAALHDRLAAARPGRRGRGAAQQRTADRARAGGHRADRRAVPRRSCPEPRPHYPAVVVGPGPRAGRARRADRAPGGPDVGGRASSTRWPRWPPTACARGRRRPARWATRRCWRSSTARCRRTRRAERTVSTTRRFVRRQRSWFRRDPAAHLVRRGPPRPGRRRRLA